METLQFFLFMSRFWIVYPEFEAALTLHSSRDCILYAHFPVPASFLCMCAPVWDYSNADSTAAARQPPAPLVRSNRSYIPTYVHTYTYIVHKSPSTTFFSTSFSVPRPFPVPSYFLINSCDWKPSHGFLRFFTLPFYIQFLSFSLVFSGSLFFLINRFRSRQG